MSSDSSTSRSRMQYQPQDLPQRIAQTIEDHADLMNSASDFGTAQRMPAAAASASRAKNQRVWPSRPCKKKVEEEEEQEQEQEQEQERRQEEEVIVDNWQNEAPEAKDVGTTAPPYLWGLDTLRDRWIRGIRSTLSGLVCL